MAALATGSFEPTCLRVRPSLVTHLSFRVAFFEALFFSMLERRQEHDLLFLSLSSERSDQREEVFEYLYKAPMAMNHWLSTMLSDMCPIADCSRSSLDLRNGMRCL